MSLSVSPAETPSRSKPASGSRRPVWVVTGASSGLGQAIALEAAKSGTVVAIGRNEAGLDGAAKAGCRVVKLDLKSLGDQTQSTAAVNNVLEGLDHVDILVNAAGYILEGAVEETSEEECLDVFNTNVFAPIRLARAFLPSMRQARRGVIVNIGGVGGFNGSPNAGFYCASKSAISTLTEALQRETKPLGIRVCLVQLGHFRTSFLESGHRVKVARHIPDYDDVLEPLRSGFDGLNGAQPGDPKKAALAIVKAVNGNHEDIPFLLALGSDVPAAELSSHAAKREAFSNTSDITTSTDL